MSHKPNTCHICDAPSLLMVTGYTALQRVTSDCKPWPKGGTMGVCKRCGTTQKVIDSVWQAEIERIYADYTIYHQSGGVEQAVFEQSLGQAAPRSGQLLLRLIQEIPLPGTGRLLDIGCGNGATLRAFNQIRLGWSLAGTEFDDKYKGIVEQIPGVEALYVGTLEQIPGRFNVITMIHVLEHIPAPQGFLGQVWDKLEDDGLLIIEVPDHRQNPFELLIADHSTHFTVGTLSTLLEQTGFEVVSHAIDWIPKEISVAARKVKQQGDREWPAIAWQENYAALQTRIEWLQSVILNTLELSAGGHFGLFGTSIAGTWLFSTLGDRVTFFVDEDPARSSRTYGELPIYAPQDVPEGSHVFIALPFELARQIQTRLGGLRSGIHYYTPTALREGL